MNTNDFAPATDAVIHLQSLADLHTFLIDRNLPHQEVWLMRDIYDAVEKYDALRLPTLSIASAMMWTALARFSRLYDLCPMHLWDVEICEDDEDDTCADLR